MWSNHTLDIKTLFG